MSEVEQWDMDLEVWDEDNEGDDDFLGRSEMKLAALVDEATTAGQQGLQDPSAEHDYVLTLTGAGRKQNGVVSVSISVTCMSGRAGGLDRRGTVKRH
eukprot:3768338-Prymnesium_polylepis.1